MKEGFTFSTRWHSYSWLIWTFQICDEWIYSQGREECFFRSVTVAEEEPSPRTAVTISTSAAISQSSPGQMNDNDDTTFSETDTNTCVEGHVPQQESQGHLPRSSVLMVRFLNGWTHAHTGLTSITKSAQCRIAVVNSGALIWACTMSNKCRKRSAAPCPRSTISLVCCSHLMRAHKQVCAV